MGKVSIVVRSMNDIRYIDRTMGMIRKQKFTDYELLNVDSGSTDGTYDAVQKFSPDISWQIKPEEYVPGKVLNSAVEKCTGEYIVFNNSDCIPQSEYWLENLIAPLEEDSNVAAVFGRQLCRPDARPLVRKDGERAFGDGCVAANWGHFFSLATSAVRHSLLKEFPFDPDIKYSEDIEWSWRMKQKGYKIIYAPDAEVEHSHNYTLKEVRKRFYNEGLAEGQIYRRSRSFTEGFILPLAAETLRDISYLIKNRKIVAVPGGIIYRMTQKYNIYKGRRDYFRNKQREINENN